MKPMGLKLNLRHLLVANDHTIGIAAGVDARQGEVLYQELKRLAIAQSGYRRNLKEKPTTRCSC